MHLEGSLEPEMMFALAERNGVEPTSCRSYRMRNWGSTVVMHPSKKPATRITSITYRNHLALYFQGMSVLHTEQDFHDLTYSYFERAHADTVRHCEMFFDPQGHTTRRIPTSLTHHHQRHSGCLAGGSAAERNARHAPRRNPHRQLHHAALYVGRGAG